MSAHSHYRKGEMKDAIVDANNALYADIFLMPTLRPKPLISRTALVN